jgi:hypothetical protein
VWPGLPVEEMHDRQFVIRTDEPNVKVSWQVTGIRQDAWANENRIPVEEDKPVNKRGRYLHPKAFGKPIELSEGIVSDKQATICENDSN